MISVVGHIAAWSMPYIFIADGINNPSADGLIIYQPMGY